MCLAFVASAIVFENRPNLQGHWERDVDILASDRFCLDTKRFKQAVKRRQVLDYLGRGSLIVYSF